MKDNPQRILELPALPTRPAEAHKGAFGRVLILGGSLGMSGAACLCGQAALRGGAGLVYLAVPRGILPIVAAVEPSYLTIPLPEDDHGRTALAAREQIAEVIPQQTALAVGPGWGMSEDLVALARWLFAEVQRPAVIDADGLNALANRADGLPEPAGERILTPHPGELSRLCGESIPTIQKNRETLAAEFAARHGVVLVLKGAGTVITDGEDLAVNTTGNSGMATGGTGDVLTGLIAALLAHEMSAFSAAQLGVYLHGLAGDLAAEDLTGRGLIASDLPGYLPQAWKNLKE